MSDIGHCTRISNSGTLRAVLTIRAMTGGAGYAQRHLEHGDYYDEHRRVQGEWQGRGAELLGLRGSVTPEQFEAVREGMHLETGEFPRPRHSADRTNGDGSEQSKARSLYDLTFSAPKSVSVQAMVGGDDRLIATNDKAVREALADAENYASSRVRLNGANENRTTGNWIVATYRHDKPGTRSATTHTPWPQISPTTGLKAAGKPGLGPVRAPGVPNGGLSECPGARDARPRLRHRAAPRFARS